MAATPKFRIMKKIRMKYHLGIGLKYANYQIWSKSVASLDFRTLQRQNFDKNNFVLTLFVLRAPHNGYLCEKLEIDFLINHITNIHSDYMRK